MRPCTPVVLLALLFTCSAHAADPPKHAAAPSPRWLAFEPGAWVVTRITYRGVNFHADGVTYQRTLLLGPDPAGGLHYVNHKADQPAGPWTVVFEHADGHQWYEGDTAQVKDVGEQTLTLGERSIHCRAYDVRVSDSFGATTGRRWVDATTNVEVLAERNVESKSKSGDVVTRKSTLTTLRAADLKLLGRTISVFEQRWVEEREGKPEKIYNWVVSASVPGWIVLQHAWLGQDLDTTKPPNMKTEVIDWGTSAELLAQYRQEHPTLDERRKKDDQERIARVQKLFRDTIALASSADAAIRARAVGTLSAWGEPAEVKGEVLPVLEKAMADPSPLVRREAPIGLAKCKVPGAAARIVRLMNDDAPGRPQYLAALALTADPAALDPLLAATRDDQFQLRTTAARGLAEIKGEPARLALEHLLDDTDFGVRITALSSLQKLADKQSLPLILKTLADPNRTVRMYAAQAAAEIGDDTALPPLVKLLADPDEQVRAAACLWLTKLKVQDRLKVGDVILPLLKDPSVQVRGNAVLACAGLKEIRAVPALVEIAGDPQNAKLESGMFGSIGNLAMISLGKIGDESARAALTKLNASNDPAVARAAAAQLKAIDSPTLQKR
ncbi:MAG: lyase domain protein repeat-containing protein [Phycisphaerales bacterium]|nr:lyase domain protein repeat-containing protein [Phycisphaerales bacterium]